ncbi:MAG: hypothetical protein Q4G09_03415 [Clostridia bacterium]|nr:hypothetical protein [Clostridia bacterium]
MYIRIDIVNKKQYEVSDNYKEVKIIIPKDIEELKKDFLYLGLDYDSLSIQDTHIKECDVICRDNPAFSAELSGEINNIIVRASESGYTTPFNDINKFYDLIKGFEKEEERDKLLAILEAKRENIENIKDAIKFVENINCFELIEAENTEELARKLIYNGEIDMEDLIDYANLDRLGDEYADDKGMIKTEQGFLMQECDLKCDLEQEDEFGGDM